MCNFLRVCSCGQRVDSEDSKSSIIGPLSFDSLCLIMISELPITCEYESSRFRYFRSSSQTQCSKLENCQMITDNNPGFSLPIHYSTFNILRHGHNQIIRRRRVRRLSCLARERLWTRHRRAPGDLRRQQLHAIVADWYAAHGFVALCPDLFWRQERGVQLTDKGTIVRKHSSFIRTR